MIVDTQRTKKNILIASTFSSIVSTLVTNPIEVAKLNLQYYPLNCPQYPHSNFKQLIACSCSNFSVQGSIKSLKVVLPQVTISNILYMQLYENRVQYFKKIHNLGVTTSTIFSTIIARTFVSTIMLPLQILRIRLSNSVQSSSLLNFKSFKVTLIRDLSYSLLFWLTLQHIRNYFTSNNYRQHLRTQHQSSLQIIKHNLIPSLITGGFISAITTPVDTIKTRIQSNSKSDQSIIKEMLKIYQKQKMMGLFSGVHYRVLKNSLHASLYISLYEFVLNRLKHKQSNNY